MNKVEQYIKKVNTIMKLKNKEQFNILDTNTFNYSISYSKMLFDIVNSKFEFIYYINQQNINDCYCYITEQKYYSIDKGEIIDKNLLSFFIKNCIEYEISYRSSLQIYIKNIDEYKLIDLINVLIENK